MRYKIVYEKRALRELSKLPSNAVRQIIAKIESLAENPYQSGVKKLTSVENVYRARVGSYRILYQIDAGNLLNFDCRGR